MQDGAVLDVGLGADLDGSAIAPDDDLVPDRGAVAEGDLADDDGAGRDEHVLATADVGRQVRSRGRHSGWSGP